MTQPETRAILTLSLMAAFVDGDKHDRERAEIKRIAEGLSQDDGVQLPTLYQDVLMKRVALADVLPALQTHESRQLAYEMAVCVCDADGAQSQAEQTFLAQLRTDLALDNAPATQFGQQADAMAEVPLSAGALAPAAASATDRSAAAGPSTVGSATALDPAQTAALDGAILNAAIVNGALELLPESLSTLAIIPLQMKLVYRIGQAHGVELDRGHIKDFLATAGVGLTSQYLEQAGRKLLGGLLGRVGGGMLGGVGKQAVSSGMSFAATYALGHVAKRYYAGGRVLSTQLLKDSYATLLQEAQALQSQHLPAIRERARTLDAGKVMAMVRG